MAATAMEDQKSARLSPLCYFRSVFAAVWSWFRRLMLRILAVGPVPRHIAIIMDGNRRFADRSRMKRSRGHLLGYEGLIATLENCLELGVKYVTVYAFSIDNFARPEEEVNSLMTLMEEKLNDLVEKVHVVKDFGVRVQVLGDLTLLPVNVQAAAERAMAATKENRSVVLNLCVSYTSTSEIVHSIQQIRDNMLMKSCAAKPLSMETSRLKLLNGGWRGLNGLKHDIFTDRFAYDIYNSGVRSNSNLEILGKQKADVMQQNTQTSNGHGIYQDMMSPQKLVNGGSHDEARLENGKIGSESRKKLATECLWSKQSSSCVKGVKVGSDFLNSEGPHAMIEAITVKDIDNHLYTTGCPPPDILIRTSGETRLSNFLLWQSSSYSRLVFCKVLWPEFSIRHLIWIILDYQRAFPALQKQQRLQEQLLEGGA